MDDVVGVYVVDSLQDLLHEDAAGQLAQHKLILDHPVKQLTATNTEIERKSVRHSDRLREKLREEESVGQRQTETECETEFEAEYDTERDTEFETVR